MKLLSVTALLFACACLCVPDGVCAHPRAIDSPYVVSVEDNAGQALRSYHHAGQTFVLGHFGERYNIRVRNRTGRRVEAVVSVDGRDVVSGSVGDFVAERGHLIEAYDDLLIEGFRQSWDNVAAFRFSNPGESYSARLGTPENVGVIGVAIFPERVQRSRRRPMPFMPRRDAAPAAPRSRYESDDAAPAPAAAHADRKVEGLGGGSRAAANEGSERQGYAASPARSQDNLGTEYGESVDSSVQEVAFARADSLHPAQLITLRYDDREGLIARGIIVDPKHVSHARCGPHAFPNSRFAQPPP